MGESLFAGTIQRHLVYIRYAGEAVEQATIHTYAISHFERRREMITTELVLEERDVKDFYRVRWTGYGELVIQQGDRESLTIETDPDLLPKIVSEVEYGKLELGRGGTWRDQLNFAFETSLTRKPIYYRLTVRS